MSAYCTVADMVAQFGETELVQLSDPDGLSLDAAVVGKAIADASTVIDSYVSRRYPLPLVPAPDVLRPICQDMALFRLMTLRRRGDLEDARYREEKALAWLQDVAAGRATLGEGHTPPQPGGQVRLTSAPRLFDREGLRGY